MRRKYTIFFIGAMVVAGCATMKQNAIAKGGAIGITQSCVKTNLQRCDALGHSFEQYIMQNKTNAARHAKATIEANVNVDMRQLTAVLELAANLAQKQAPQINEFSSFLTKIANQMTQQQESADALNHPNPTTNSLSKDQEKNDAVGCGHDDQCKGDRICVAKQCVSLEYAGAMEQQHMNRAGVPRGSDIVNRKQPEVSLQQSIVDLSQNKCNFKSIDRCSKKCEQGSIEFCLDSARYYLSLPDAQTHALFVLYALEKACNGDNAEACVSLGALYAKASTLLVDYQISLELNVKACQLKDKYGCMNTALLLHAGLGTRRNTELARQYLSSACKFGLDKACRSSYVQRSTPNNPETGVYGPVSTKRSSVEQ